MKITPLNYKYQTNFKAVHENLLELNSSNKIKMLNHTTQFFRYREMDEFITKKLKYKQLFSNKPLNIISAGCSFGEEVYSYAITLNNSRKKPPNEPIKNK